MPATAHTFTLAGVEAAPVRVEVEVGRGMPGFAIVGLPDAAVRESRERVRAALQNSGFEFPQQRIVVNLAPAGLRKAGAALDLAIAAGILAASGQLDRALLDACPLAGELALDGSVRPIPGALAMSEAAQRRGAERIAVPSEDAPDAAWVDGLDVVPLERLDQLHGLASGIWTPPAVRPREPAPAPELPDLAELRGQDMFRLALEVAAAGGHHLLVLGPAGSGKSMGLRRLPSIMPPLEPAEALEVMRIAGAVGRPADPHVRPFRAPHHTISHAGLVGGGSPPRPGEVTLAHRGVLFLDELPEFDRPALESLRAPLEDGEVSIVRATGAVTLPCRFQLVAAANPCPCGRGADDERCTCDPLRAQRYLARLSGALADRIDIQMFVKQPSAEDLEKPPGEDSEAVRARVAAARAAQVERLGRGRCNAEMTPQEIRRFARLDREGRQMLRDGQRVLGLSGRGHDRVLRVARSLADLAGADAVQAPHVKTALQMRSRKAQS